MSAHEVYQLSFIAGTIHRQKGTLVVLQQIAQEEIPKRVEKLGWKVVWGPAVWKADRNVISGPDHVWYVAKKDGEEDYAVAVADTATTYNHVVHNADVGQVVDFFGWVTADGLHAPPAATRNIVETRPYVSLGTANGVYTLHSEKIASPGAKGHGQTLPTFLQTLNRGSTVSFTGYSLGGSLSVTLALTLVQESIFDQEVKVQTLPIAGPSPFNATFVDIFSKTFESSGEGWNRNIVNKLDIVPQAWNTEAWTPGPQTEWSTNEELRLENIPTIYNSENEKNRPPLADVVVIVNKARNIARKSGLTYKPLPSLIYGPDNFHTGKVLDPVKTPNNLKEFATTAGVQHKIYWVNIFTPLPPNIQEEASFVDLVIEI